MECITYNRGWLFSISSDHLRDKALEQPCAITIKVETGQRNFTSNQNQTDTTLSAQLQVQGLK